MKMSLIQALRWLWVTASGSLVGCIVQDHQLAFMQSQGSVDVAFFIAEFDFEDLRCKLLDDGSYLAAVQTAVWKVFYQSHNV